MRLRRLIELAVVAGASLALFAFFRINPTEVGPAGQFAKETFVGSDVEVFSLEPRPMDGVVLTMEQDDGRFHGYEIKGSVKLREDDAKQSSQRETIRDALTVSLMEPSDRTAKACLFFPRHGLRVTNNGTSVDFVICLQCCDVDVGTKRYWLDLKTMKALRSALNAPLKDAGVPLADGTE